MAVDLGRITINGVLAINCDTDPSTGIGLVAPIGSYSVASASAALTQLNTIERRFDNPIYVNPAEFVAIAKKKVGTAPSAGVVAYVISLDYSWE